MSSKREEERNEKIIRGLMKLPPNRRCINCNSLGPQYVCINFWTFVCMTCSGIHREFTHRVKSVSMSKFTSQEVEALQNGGNQRAKEMFLKDWEFERQRLPSVNNTEKIREFIKHVYVDRKYTTGKSSEKPPKYMQSQRTIETETRRANSYHSYSQSPPYDFQYEERSNRKHGVMLTRKPGSDRGIYEAKISGLYSPGRYSDHMTEERFTIEGSSSRVSDYSFSSGLDPFRSHPQSPDSMRGSGFNSPTFDHSKESHSDVARNQAGIANMEVHVQNDGVVVPNAQRMVSSITCGNNTASSLNPVNFANFAEAFPQSDQSTPAHQNKASTVLSSSHSFAPVNTTVDYFKEPHETNPVKVASPVGLLPVMPSLVDMFQVTSDSSAPTANFVSTHTSLSSMSFFEGNSQNSKDMNFGATYSQPALNNLVSSNTQSLSSLSFFEDIPPNPSAMNVGTAHCESLPKNVASSHNSSVSLLSFLDENPQNRSPMNPDAAQSDSVPDNIGWATFDLPQHTSASESHDIVAVADDSGTGASVGNFNSLATSQTNTQWPDFLSSTAHGVLPPITNLQHENLSYNPALALALNNQEWRPFDDIDKQQGRGGHLLPDKPSTADHYLGSIESENFSKSRSQSTTVSFGTVPDLDVKDELSSVDQSAITYMGELHSHLERTTSNPFDIPYNAGNMHFYDMSTLQAALPNADTPSSFAGVINDSWFLQDAANPCLPAPPPGGMSYMATQAPSSQLPNVQTDGPVASIGGNPFA